ncbi:MAG TPA: lysophospholipid acyltransferase family protein [Nitrososphaerales archaeon]|nr:lysophospholipid acyltransferase family protein [Nitrososphaerales archaeon]
MSCECGFPVQGVLRGCSNIRLMCTVHQFQSAFSRNPTNLVVFWQFRSTRSPTLRPDTGLRWWEGRTHSAIRVCHQISASRLHPAAGTRSGRTHRTPPIFHRTYLSNQRLLRDTRITLDRRPRAGMAGFWTLVLNLEEELFERMTVRLAAALPPSLGYAITVCRGDFRYLLDKGSRKLITADLEKLLGDRLSPENRRDLVREYFRQRSCDFLEILSISKNPRLFLGHVIVSGREHLDSALARGKGAILCSAHFGKPEVCCAVLGALGIPVTGITWWSFKTKQSHSQKRRFPQRVGNDDLVLLVRPPIVSRPGDLTLAIKAASVLRRNEVILTNIDVNVRSRDMARSVRPIFLNHRAKILPGSVQIAKHTGAPLLVALIHRSRDRRHHRLEISPPVPTDGDDTVVLERCLAIVEAAILREPAQWRYWGTRHLLKLGLAPDNPPRYEKRTYG